MVCVMELLICTLEFITFCAELDYDFRCIYIDRPDHVQFKREIDERCEQMVEKGLLEVLTPSPLLFLFSNMSAPFKTPF